MSFGHSAFLTPHSGTTVLEYPLSIEAIIQFILVSHPSTVRVPGTEYSQTFRDERSRISHGGRASAGCISSRRTRRQTFATCSALCSSHPPTRPCSAFLRAEKKKKNKSKKRGYVYYYTRTSTWIVTGSGSRQGWVKARRARQG